MGFLDAIGAIGPYLTAASYGAGGYMQGQQQAQQRNFQQQLLATQLGMQQQLQQARMQDFAAQATLRQQQAMAEQNAFTQGKKEFPNDPTFQGDYTPGKYADYLAQRRGETIKQSEAATAQKVVDDAGYATGKALFGDQDIYKQPQQPGIRYADVNKDLATQRGLQAQNDRLQQTLEGQNQRFLAGQQGMESRLQETLAAKNAGQPKAIPGVAGPNGEQAFMVNNVPSMWNGSQYVPLAGARKQAGAGSGAQVSVADLKDQVNAIQNYKNLLDTGQTTYSDAMGAREAADANIAKGQGEGKPMVVQRAERGLSDLVNTGLGEAGIKTGIDPNDPNYQRYASMMTSVRRLADEATRVFKGRTNEAAFQREFLLAVPTPDDLKNPTRFQQKITSMNRILDLAQQSNPGQMTGGGGGASSPPAGSTAGPTTIPQYPGNPWRKPQGP